LFETLKYEFWRLPRFSVPLLPNPLSGGLLTSESLIKNETPYTIKIIDSIDEIGFDNGLTHKNLSPN